MTLYPIEVPPLSYLFPIHAPPTTFQVIPNLELENLFGNFVFDEIQW